MEALVSFLKSDYVWVLVPVVAIVMGGIVAVLKLVHRNQERLAMIERGMHPDVPSGPESSEAPGSQS